MNREKFEKDVGDVLKKRLKDELGREPNDVEYRCYVDKAYEEYLEHIEMKGVDNEQAKI